MKEYTIVKSSARYLYLLFNELSNTYDSVGTIRYLITDERVDDIEEKWLYSGVHEKGFYSSIGKKDRGMLQSVRLDDCKLIDDIWLCCNTCFKDMMDFYTIYTSKEALLTEPFMRSPKSWNKHIFNGNYMLTNDNDGVVYVALHIKLSECNKLDIKDLDDFELLYFLWDNDAEVDLGYSYGKDILYKFLSAPSYHMYTIEHTVRRKGMQLYYDIIREEVLSSPNNRTREILKHEFTDKDIAKYKLLGL